MPCKHVVAAGVLSVVVLLTACSNKHQNHPQVTKFTFAGGELKNGQIIVDASVKVTQDPTTHKVLMQRENGTGGPMSIDCACVSGGGECFPYVQDPGGGAGARIGCISVDPCDDCAMIIVQNNFTLETNVLSLRKS